MRATPEQIPDVSLSRYKYLSEESSVPLRERRHREMVNQHCCHAYQGFEYHFCGRKEGRFFPIADGSRPQPTLPNPNVPMGGDMPLWLGIVYIALVIAPLVYLILSGGR